MQFFDSLLSLYGWQGLALAGAMLVLLLIQLYYYLIIYGRIPAYRNERRVALRNPQPPLSVVVPLFAEDDSFVTERLPLMLTQNYPDFEVAVVYVGQNGEFYEELQALRQTYPHLTTTRIQLDPRFPISRKMALNIGIKSAHNDCMVFTSSDAVVQSERWLQSMGRGFERGDIVLGYCGVECRGGFTNFLMRTWQMMHSVDWIARAAARKAYRGTLHNFGFTKKIYFEANGFNRLNMNIGENDLFLQKIIANDNTALVLSSRAALRQKSWGGMRWWMSQLRYFHSAEKFYPAGVKVYIRGELWSRVLFFLSVIVALVWMPFIFQMIALGLLLVRYVSVALEIKRIARRIGEGGLVRFYFIYDLLSPLWALWLWVLLLRKDTRVWR